LELREYDTGNKSSAADSEGEEKKETAALEEPESEMRGVHAVSHIPPGTVCMTIPRRCLITVEMGQATPIGQAILQSDLDLDAPKHIFLMIYLLWDRKVNGPLSFFWPYYEILPKTLQNMPIFWSESELAELQGSYLLHQIADRSSAIAEDYRAICQIAPSLQQLCTLDEFKWARMCVCSRNFGLQIDGHRTSALVPHADMLNHYRPRETKWTFDEERQAFTITTLQHIPVGAEVYDSYGQKCNHRFLLNYGFAVEDNRELDGFCPNEVPIELAVSQTDPVWAEKVDFWTRGEPAPPPAPRIGNPLYGPEPVPAHLVKRVRVCVSNNENTRLLFSLLRTLACNEEELRSLTRGPANRYHGQDLRSRPDQMIRAYAGATSFAPVPPHLAPHHAPFYRSCRDVRHPLSIRNEREAMRLLLDVIAGHLSAYQTTLQQDHTDLLDEQVYPRYSNKRHAKIQVRGEKEVLHHFAQWARTALDVLDVMEDELNGMTLSEEGSGSSNSAVEVRLMGQRRIAVTATEEPPKQRRPGFEYVIRRMEQDVDTASGVHHTTFRYCCDVLGSLRREEIKTLRRRQQQRAHAGATKNSSSSSAAGYM
jgi:histone-lysine N-methyltransferase SETD3